LGRANPLGKVRHARPFDGEPLEDRVVGRPDLRQASCGKASLHPLLEVVVGDGEQRADQRLAVLEVVGHCNSIDKTLDEYRQWTLLSVSQTRAREASEMIARVAQFRFPDLQHREEAERNGSVRVGPSLARQPGFQAIYY